MFQSGFGPYANKISYRCLIVEYIVAYSRFVLILHHFSYGRAEIVAGFVNALFLLFVAFFIFAEAIEVQNVIFFC